MKKTMVLLVVTLTLALGAAAQTRIDFSDLPLIGIPTLIPNGYSALNWSNIYYVDPSLWPGAGSGYKDGPIQANLRAEDVAFVGGKACRQLQEACYGTISALGGPTSFQAVSATVAGGFGPTYVLVFAYHNGKYVGSVSYPLSTQMHTINFPSSWGSITQLTFQTGAGGDLVFYDLQVYLLGG